MPWFLTLALLAGGGKIEWQRGPRDSALPAALQKSREAGGVVLVYFAADW
ncbi:MAG: hypothetical protein HYY17_10250 [Planctomycetes bacterium]|nr:hypothetical protein [Planctomycetota bacterium]